MTNPNTPTPSNSVVTVPLDAPEAMWDGLPRSIMLWLDFERPTPRSLFKHLKASGYDIPAWMQAEGELKALDHVPSKGTRCVLIYRAMLENYLAMQSANTTGSDKLVERRALAEMLRDHRIYCTAPDGRFNRAAELLEANAIATPDTDRVAVLTEALVKCRDKFREYEKLHLAKVRPNIQGVVWSNKITDENRAAIEKADRNRDMADMCDVALSQPLGSEENGNG